MRWLAGLIGLVAVAFGLWSVSKSLRFQIFGEVITRIETSDPIVALTFDDGPAPRYLDEVLQTLAERDVRATFFLTGHEAEQRPELVAQIAAAGHQLGNHGFSHIRMILRSAAWIEDEISRTDAALRSSGYSGPIPFRPPYGQRLVVLPWVLSQADRPVVLWDVDADDLWEEATPESYAAELVADAEPGSIILLHVMYQSRDTARAALPLVIDGLRARGFSITTLDELPG